MSRLPSQAAVANLIASVADLAAPGSRLMFDFLHADAVDGSASYVGFEACQSVSAMPCCAFCAVHALCAVLVPRIQLKLDAGLPNSRGTVRPTLLHPTNPPCFPFNRA